MKIKKLKAVLFTICILLAYSGLKAEEYTTPPSPYFVHDSEVFFFEFYDSIMASHKPFKVGGNAILTAQHYLAGLILELPLYKTNSGNSFSVLGGYAFQASGDGKKDLDFLANNNISATHITALTWYGQKSFIRAGYIYGAFTLDDDGFYQKDGVAVKYDKTTSRHFNYDVQELEDTRGYNRLYTDPDITYNRMLFEMEWDLSFLVLKTLMATNLVNAPAFSRTGTELSFFGNMYRVMPYFCSTMDIEGIYDFSIYQGGLYQEIKSSRLAARNSIEGQNLASLSDVVQLWQINIDANYSRVPETELSEKRNDRYARIEFALAMLSAQGWWSEESGFGAGGGINYYTDSGMKLWYSFKYNSYISSPLYKRSVNDKGYSFEWGCMVAI